MGADPQVNDHYIIFFDGVCNLCNGFVNFVIDIDKKGKFRFASLQSPEASEYLSGFPDIVTGDNPDSVVLLTPEGRVFTESEAVLNAAGVLGGGWSLLKVFKILPRSFRDSIYRWVARNRYRWFGKRDVCRMPTPELRERFL